MRAMVPLRLLGLVLVALMTVAFASGTAARAAPTANDMRLNAYQLAGGLLSDLCHDHAPDHAHMESCALCHLVSGADLPPHRPPTAALERRLVATVILPQIRRAEARPRDPTTPTRGPPLI